MNDRSSIRRRSARKKSVRTAGLSVDSWESYLKILQWRGGRGKGVLEEGHCAANPQEKKKALKKRPLNWIRLRRWKTKRRGSRNEDVKKMISYPQGTGGSSWGELRSLLEMIDVFVKLDRWEERLEKTDTFPDRSHYRNVENLSLGKKNGNSNDNAGGTRGPV